MSNGPYRKPYVESSVFIAFIKGEKSQGPNHDQDAKRIFDSIISAAKAGAFKIITSPLTIAEVHKKRGMNPLTAKESEDLRPYFREEYIQMVELDRGVGERANELCRTLPADPNNGIRALRPNDALHIAAAERAECDVVLAWDEDFISQKDRISTIRLEYPEASSAPLPAHQMELSSKEQTAYETETPIPVSPEVRGGDPGHPEDQARVEARGEARAETEGEEET